MTDATSAIVLTHNIDFLFLQSVVRPRLRKCGHPKLTVFADAGCASGSYRQQHLLLDGLGRHYRVVKVEMGVGRRFHPKAIFLAGPSKAILAVGSGNLTHGGWSANFEIWASYESDDGGLPAISAFRDYLRTIENLVPQSEAISKDMFSAFEEVANPWVEELPEPECLFGVPGDRPILDAIAQIVSDDIHQITVCAPYFDPDGEALAVFSKRFAAPIRTLLQRNNAGLSARAASTLDKNVELVSVDVEPSRFVHAKLYAFDRLGSTLLVVGSANMSRAALMGNEIWGNAELVAAQWLPTEQAKVLLDDFDFFDEAPALPEIPPSENWEIQTAPLRIVAAHFTHGMMEITFKCQGDVVHLEVELEGGARQSCSDYRSNTVARFQLSKCPKSVRLHCTLENDKVITSDPSWVDDEDRLGISVPEHRIAAKLAEATEAGLLSAKGMFEILQLLHQHLEQPVRRSILSLPRENNDTTEPGPSYSNEDIFSDSFGRPRSVSFTPTHGYSRETDFLNIFTAYFTMDDVASSEDGDHPLDESQMDEEADEAQELEEIANDKVKVAFDNHQNKCMGLETSARLSKKLLAAFEKVAEAMSTDEFVSSRPPGRLAADITATALLLRKGLAEKIISEDDFMAISRRLWDILFFGLKGELGVLENFLTSCSPEDRATHETAIASPRLTAALTLWCLPDWDRNSTEEIRFRYSAMLLAAELPWLVNSASVEEIHVELRRLSRVLPSVAKFETLNTAWASWLRAGIAFKMFKHAIGAWNAKQLIGAIREDQVIRGQLLWQAGEFCVSHDNYRRDKSVNAIVYPLSGASKKIFYGNWLVPISALLNSGGLLDICDEAKQALQNILADVEKITLEQTEQQ